MSKSFFHSILCRRGGEDQQQPVEKKQKGHCAASRFVQGHSSVTPAPAPHRPYSPTPQTQELCCSQRASLPPASAAFGPSRLPLIHPEGASSLPQGLGRGRRSPQPLRLPQGELGGRVVPSAAPAGGAGGAGAGASARKMAAAACVPVRVCHQEIVRFDLEIKAAVQVAPPGAPSPHRGRGSPPLSPLGCRAPSVSSGGPR